MECMQGGGLGFCEMCDCCCSCGACHEEGGRLICREENAAKNTNKMVRVWDPSEHGRTAQKRFNVLQISHFFFIP